MLHVERPQAVVPVGHPSAASPARASASPYAHVLFCCGAAALRHRAGRCRGTAVPSRGIRSLPSCIPLPILPAPPSSSLFLHSSLHSRAPVFPEANFLKISSFVLFFCTFKPVSLQFGCYRWQTCTGKKRVSYCWLSFYLLIIWIPVHIHKTFQDLLTLGSCSRDTSVRRKAKFAKGMTHQFARLFLAVPARVAHQLAAVTPHPLIREAAQARTAD